VKLKPTDEQFETAILWLLSNEGEGAERGACEAVAHWIERRQAEVQTRTIAREANIPVAQIRKRLASVA
jgi:acyl transferase domain-containing protein